MSRRRWSAQGFSLADRPPQGHYLRPSLLHNCTHRRLPPTRLQSSPGGLASFSGFCVNGEGLLPGWLLRKHRKETRALIPHSPSTPSFVRCSWCMGEREKRRRRRRRTRTTSNTERRMMACIAVQTYPRKVLGLQEHLHEVGDAAGDVADHVHDGNGDGGSCDSRLATSKHIFAAAAQILCKTKWIVS